MRWQALSGNRCRAPDVVAATWCQAMTMQIIKGAPDGTKRRRSRAIDCHNHAHSRSSGLPSASCAVTMSATRNRGDEEGEPVDGDRSAPMAGLEIRFYRLIELSNDEVDQPVDRVGLVDVFAIEADMNLGQRRKSMLLP